MAPNAPKPLVRRLFALFRDGHVTDRDHRLAVCSFITWQPITTTDDLTELDIGAIVNTLQYWKTSGEIEYRCRRIAEQLMIQEVTA